MALVGREVLGESYMMIPDSKQRMITSLEELFRRVTVYNGMERDGTV